MAFWNNKPSNNRDWNQGGGPSGEGVRKGDNCFGVTDRLDGNKGKVKETWTSFGENWVRVEWTHGPRRGQIEDVRQGEVAGTNM